MIEDKEMLNGWKSVRLGEVCEKVSVVKRNEKKPAEEFLYIDIGSIDNSKNKIISHKNYQWQSAPSRAQQIIKQNDVLFSTVRTYLKNIAIVEKDIYNNQIASSGFTVIRGKKELAIPKFLFYYSISQNFLRPLNELQTGSSYPAVRDKDVFSQLIPLPSILEQQKIVSKIEELFSELDKGIEQLKIAQQQLKVYRQTVLKWAFEGKLTNENVQEGELPKGWKKVSLQEICDPKRKCSYGVLVPGDDVEDGVRLVRVGDINEKGDIDTLNLKKILPAIANKFKRTFLEGGEVLISLVGAIGRTAVAPSSLKGANTARAIGVIPVDKKINSKFVEAMLRTPMKIDEHNKKAHEVARKTLNLEDVVSSKIPLPPREEQDLIVQEIESRLSVADKLEETINNSLQQAEALRQSILKKAFEGRLV